VTSIHTALTEFLNEQHAHLSNRKYRNYESVIFHFKSMFVSERFGTGGNKEARRLHEKAVETGREDDAAAFLKVVHAWLIVEVIRFFLRHHMRHEVIESQEVEWAAVPAMKKLAEFLADRKYINKETAQRAKKTIKSIIDDDDDYEVYDSYTVAKIERETGNTIRLIPHNPYLPVILGQAKKLIRDLTRCNELGIVRGDGVNLYLPDSFAERRALHAVQRIAGVIRPLFDAPEGVALYAPDDCVKHPPLHLVKLRQADVNMLVAATESMRWAWGPEGDCGPLEIQTLDGLIEQIPPDWEPMHPYDQLEALLTLDVDEDMRTLIEIIRSATADVTLTADQESAYQRVMARLNAAMTLTDDQCPRCGNAIYTDNFYSAVSGEEICERCMIAEEQDMEQGRPPAPRDTWPVHSW